MRYTIKAAQIMSMETDSAFMAGTSAHSIAELDITEPKCEECDRD
jgi:hypothetical protein